MASDPTGYAGPHPDLRQLYCDALKQLREQMEAAGQRAAAPAIPADLRPDDLTIRCQRTWRDVRSRSPNHSGGEFSASVVQFVSDETHYSFLIEASRPAGSGEWQWAGMTGGRRSSKRIERGGGFGMSSGEHVCVGGLIGPPGLLSWLLRRRPLSWLFPKRSYASIQVEHADGTAYSAAVEDDGCAIVFAPVTSEPSPTDEVAVRYLDAAGRVVSEDRVWIGDGGPPPPEMLQGIATR